MWATVVDVISWSREGTGGAGPTILETTFLLAGEPAIAYKDGKEYSLPPVSERRCVDFGPGLRKRDVWLYNLPEVKSSFKVCAITWLCLFWKWCML